MGEFEVRIAEGLVVHPGDTLVLRLDHGIDARAARRLDRALPHCTA